MANVAATSPGTMASDGLLARARHVAGAGAARTAAPAQPCH